MDPKLAAKLRILADAAKYDASCASSGAPKRSGGKTGLGSTSGMGICHAYTPDGRCVSLLKILLTNWCLYDCAYCVNRRSSNTPRARFTVEEVVTLTLEFYKRNYIEGLFLSSGVVKSPDHTMEELLRVARSLRRDHGFAGYIHLKAIPEASPWLVEQAGRWADRLSINLELPTEASLARLAPEKRAPSITAAMGQMHDTHHRGQGREAPLRPRRPEHPGHRRRRRHHRRQRPRRQRPALRPIRPPPRLLLRLQPDPRAQRRAAGQAARRSSARTASTRPTGCCASTASASRRSPPAASTACSISTPTPSSPGRSSTATNSRSTSTAPPASFYCASPASAPRPSAASSRPGVTPTLRLDDLARLTASPRRAAAFIVTADHRAAGLDRLDLRSRLVRPPEQLSLFA